MPTYITLMNYTDQGIRNVKDSPKRLDAAREMARGLKVEIKNVYLTMGKYDLVVVSEAPDDEAAAKFALKLTSAGNVRGMTLRAFPEAKYREVIAALG